MKSSSLQLETLVMEEHGDLSKPTTNSRGKIERLRSWDELTNLLNRMALAIRDLPKNGERAASGTGGGPAVYTKLTDLEQRILNLIGHQVATGLALEEAGFAQEISVATEVSDYTPVIVASSQVEENVELPNEPEPHQNYIISSTLPLHTHANVENQIEEATQGTPRQCIRSSPRRIARGSSHAFSRGSPQRSRRRSPRRLIRPAHSDEAAQHFLTCDREWRQFRIEQH
ncbi:hypothetical protein ACJJTC_013454 [Scirpophaga incertulas]